jgi:hypothetical protein
LSTAKRVAMSPATIDDVKKALNEFAALYGQADARNVMARVGGAPALKDVAGLRSIRT